VNLDDARAAYCDALDLASIAYQAARVRPDARMARAMRLAGQIPNGRLTPEEVASYQTGVHEAGVIWQQIIAGPTADVDQALAASRRKPNTDDPAD
jgi:hypothetical protein